MERDFGSLTGMLAAVGSLSKNSLTAQDFLLLYLDEPQLESDVGELFGMPGKPATCLRRPGPAPLIEIRSRSLPAAAGQGQGKRLRGQKGRPAC